MAKSQENQHFRHMFLELDGSSSGPFTYTVPDSEKIYIIKNRPLHNPLIIHVASLEEAKMIGKLNNTAMKMAKAFWPGPLTLLVEKKRNNGITPAATSNLDSIAIRVPSNPIILKILNTFGKPIAAPSANLSGTVSATNASHVFDDFGDDI